MSSSTAAAESPVTTPVDSSSSPSPSTQFSPKQLQMQMEPKSKAADGSSNGGKDERHWLPEHFEPGPCDVVCGRGKSCVQHPGNVQFRTLVASKLPQYSKASNTKLDKSLLLTALVDQVRQACSNYHQQKDVSAEQSCPSEEQNNYSGREIRGGFVKKDSGTGKWYEVGDFLAREKVSQAFRDCLHENYKSSNLSKKKKRKEHQQQMMQHEQQHLNHQDGSSSMSSSKSSSPTCMDAAATPPATTSSSAEMLPQPPQILAPQNSSASSFSVHSNQSNNGNNLSSKTLLIPSETDVLLPSNSVEDGLFRNRPGNMLFLDLIHHFCQVMLAHNPQYAHTPHALSQDLDLILGEIVPQVFVSLWQKGVKFWVRDISAASAPQQQQANNNSEWREAENTLVKQAMGRVVCEILGIEAPPALLYAPPQPAHPQPQVALSAAGHDNNALLLQQQQQQQQQLHVHPNEPVTSSSSSPSSRRLSLPLGMEREQSHASALELEQHQQHLNRRGSLASSASAPLPEGADPRLLKHLQQQQQQQQQQQAHRDPRMAAEADNSEARREQERRLLLAQQQQRQEAEETLRLENLMSQYSSRTQIDLDMAQLENVMVQARNSENVSMLQAAVQAELRLPLLRQLCRLDQYRPLPELEAELNALRQKLAHVTGSMTERLSLVQRIQHVKECCEREQMALQQYLPQLQQLRALRQQLLLAPNGGPANSNNAVAMAPSPSPSMVMKALQQQQQQQQLGASGGPADPHNAQASLMVQSNEPNHTAHPSSGSALERALRATSMKSRGFSDQPEVPEATVGKPATVPPQKKPSTADKVVQEPSKNVLKEATETTKPSSNASGEAPSKRLPLKKRKRLMMMMEEESHGSDTHPSVMDPPAKKQQQQHSCKLETETSALEALAALATSSSTTPSALAVGSTPVKSGNPTETTVSA